MTKSCIEIWSKKTPAGEFKIIYRDMEVNLYTVRDNFDLINPKLYKNKIKNDHLIKLNSVTVFAKKINDTEIYSNVAEAVSCLFDYLDDFLQHAIGHNDIVKGEKHLLTMYSKPVPCLPQDISEEEVALN